MGNNSNLLDHPEIKLLNRALLSTLLEESDRGAILIGAAHVEDHLRQLTAAVFPSRMSNKMVKSLLAYQGALGTFSNKIEVAYAFRLIPRSLYDALNSLRAIRNDAAHSPGVFNLRLQEDRIDRMLALGPDMHIKTRRRALNILINFKSGIVFDTIQEHRRTDPELSFPINTKQDAVEYILNEPEYVKVLQAQLPHWVLVLGISLICGMLVHYRDKIRENLLSDVTFFQLLKSRTPETK